MSEATHYWPTTQGPFLIEHPSGDSTEWVLVLSDWGRKKVWHYCSTAFTEAEMIERGYLGVRREAEKHGSAAIAQQALDELRACQTKPAESERWFYKWGPVLCQMLGAR